MSETIDKPKLQTFDVEVRQTVRVTLDPTKFTPEFMAEFRESFYRFTSLTDHAKYLAQLAARGLYEMSPYLPNEFVEGYGPIGEMGISAEVLDGEEEVLP